MGGGVSPEFLRGGPERWRPSGSGKASQKRAEGMCHKINKY